jgi:hypothetical protein
MAGIDITPSTTPRTETENAPKKESCLFFLDRRDVERVASFRSVASEFLQITTKNVLIKERAHYCILLILNQ